MKTTITITVSKNCNHFVINYYGYSITTTLTDTPGNIHKVTTTSCHGNFHAPIATDDSLMAVSIHWTAWTTGLAGLPVGEKLIMFIQPTSLLNSCKFAPLTCRGNFRGVSSDQRSCAYLISFNCSHRWCKTIISIFYASKQRLEFAFYSK